MTMSDAPEKIWATGNATTGSWNIVDVRHCPGSEYTRTDVALAMVAAEREACAKIADKHAVEAQKAKEMGRQDSPTDMVGTASWGRASALIASAIRARTEADAQAALERVKREARNEALREATEHWSQGQDAILALMEDTDDD